MRRIPLTAFAAALLLSSALPARAALCAIDDVPAATLLLPYFEVDLSKFPKLNKVDQTVISLQNVSAAPALAHVVLWTDLSVPTLAFDVFLTGFDVEEINLTELFYTGEIRDLANGSLSSESEQRGFVLGETEHGGLQSRGSLIKAHRGQKVKGKCYARKPGGNVARGYVTIDNVNVTSTLFPGDPGYFDNGNGVARNTNQLWGIVFVKSKKTIQSDLLVHIEAGDFDAGDYTFYGRYNDFLARDDREPLGFRWAARYLSGSRKSDLIVWRDSNAVQGPFDCEQLGESGWYPLSQTQVVAFSEDGDAPFELFFDPADGVEPGFPAETQKIRIGGSDLSVAPFRSGWLFLNLQDPELDFATQSYVWLRQMEGRRASLYPALPWYDDDSIEGDSSEVSTCGSPVDRLKDPIP